MVGKLLRVLLVDDHEVVRHGIRALLGAHEDVGIVLAGVLVLLLLRTRRDDRDFNRPLHPG